MKNLDLAPNENIILYDEDVMVDNKSGELYLTNINLVFVYQAGMIFKQDVIVKYPLNQIKHSNDQLQLFIDKDNISMCIYFIDKQIEFDCSSLKKIRAFATNIQELIFGEGSIIKFNESGSNLSFGEITDNLTETVGALGGFLKNKIKVLNEDAKNKLKNVQKEERVTIKCNSCGSNLTGIKGTTIICKYCGTKQVI